MNSRPVYTRQGVNIPRNYSGNAFTEAEFTDLTPGVPEEEVKGPKKDAPVSKKLFGGASSFKPTPPHGPEEAECRLPPKHGDDCGCDPHPHEEHGACPTCGKPHGSCTCAPPKHGGHGKGFGRFFPSPNFRFDFGKLFSNGIGFEEILIIGLILLFMQGDKDANDIIILLALLLFI